MRTLRSLRNELLCGILIRPWPTEDPDDAWNAVVDLVARRGNSRAREAQQHLLDVQTHPILADPSPASRSLLDMTVLRAVTNRRVLAFALAILMVLIALAR